MDIHKIQKELVDFLYANGVIKKRARTDVYNVPKEFAYKCRDFLKLIANLDNSFYLVSTNSPVKEMIEEHKDYYKCNNNIPEAVINKIIDRIIPVIEQFDGNVLLRFDFEEYEELNNLEYFTTDEPFILPYDLSLDYEHNIVKKLNDRIIFYDVMINNMETQKNELVDVVKSYGFEVPELEASEEELF